MNVLGTLFVVVMLGMNHQEAKAEELTVSVQPFYSQGALVTDRLLPFSVSHSDGRDINVTHVKATNGCHTMKDPYRNEIFHVFCQNQGKVILEVEFKAGVTPLKVKLPEFQVRRQSIADEDMGDGSDLYTLGRTKFNLNGCTTCHGPSKPFTRKQSPSTFYGAVKSKDSSVRDSMGPYDGVFTDDELKAVIEYINTDWGFN